MSATRRAFLGTVPSLAGAAALAAHQGEVAPLQERRTSPLDGVAREKIRITDIRVTDLAYRLAPEEQWPDADSNVVIVKTESVIVEVATDAGLTGIGGCSRYNGPEQMKQYAESVIKPRLIGRNPFDVESLCGGISAHGARGAWAGVDTALWDIIGKATGTPEGEDIRRGGHGQPGRDHGVG